MACRPVTKTLRSDFGQVGCISCTADGSELHSPTNVSELPIQTPPLEFCHSVLVFPLCFLGSIQVKVANDLIVIAFLEELLHYSPGN